MKTKITLALAFIVGSAMTSFGQVFLTEDFEGAMDGTTDIPVGWTETTLSTDGGWNTDNATNASSAYLVYPAALNGTDFAFTNDDACDCDKSADRMILPVQDFSTYVDVILTSDVFFVDLAGDILTCEVSTDGGSTWTVAFTYTATAGVWVDDQAVSLTAWAGMSNITVSWLYNDAAAWGYGCAIDDISLEGFTAAIIDAKMVSNPGEYTQVPLSQTGAIGTDGTIINLGSSDVTNATMTVNVYDGGMLNVYTDASTPITVVGGDTVPVTVAGYTPTLVDVYTVEQIVSITEADINITNDTSYYMIAITDSTFARDNGVPVNYLGVPIGTTATVGLLYQVNNAETFTSVSFFSLPVIGDTISVVIHDVVAGLPGTQIGQSVEHIITPADTGGVMLTLDVADMGGASLMLAAGTYYVGIVDYINTDNMAIALTAEIFTPNTALINIDGGAYSPTEVLGFVGTYIVRMNFGPTCGGTTSSITETSCGDYTAPSGAVLTSTGTYTDIIPNYCGGDSTITINLTVTALDLNVSEAGGVLTSDQGTPATYQWYDCTVDSDLSGETGQSYTPTVTGSYSVIVTNGACSDTSACTAVTVGGITDIAANGGIEIYPNPSNGQFSVNVNGITTDALSIEVIDMTGRVIETRTFDNVQGQLTTSIEIDVQEGAYLLRISANGETVTQSIVISKK